MISTRSLGLLLDGRRPAMAALGAVSFLGGAAEAGFLLIVTRVAFDLATGEEHLSLGPVDGMSAVAAVAFALVAIRVLLAIVAGRMSADLVSSAVGSIRQELADAFLRSSWRVQQSSPPGRLQELLTTFVQGGADLLTSATALVASVLSLSALLLAALISDPAATAVAAVVIVSLGAVLRPIRGAIKRRARRASEAGMDFATSLSDTSSVMLESQVFHVQDAISQDVARRVDHAAHSNRQLLFARSLIQPAYVGAAYTALLAALLAVYMVDRSALASVATVMVVMLRGLSYGQAAQVASAAIASNEPFVAELTSELRRLHASRPRRGLAPLDVLDRLELDGVGFHYGDDAALDGISVTLERGVAIGIVGPSGSGKSTLAQVILGLLTPSSGEVRANGAPAEDFDPDDWSRRVTFVPQSPKLVSGTIADNIRFFRPVSDEAVVAAAKRAHIHEEIVAMRGGYGQQVIQGALSGGQQQRLCIARALVEDPDLIVLDEPTSALDLRSERLIGETLAELRRSKTVVIIAHRLSTLNGCDKLMVIQAGRLVGFDEPDRLSTTNPFYAEVLRISQLT